MRYLQDIHCELVEWVDVELSAPNEEPSISWIAIRKAESIEAQNAIAIHLLYPNKATLDHAIESAIRDGFKVIMLHNQLTWPQAKGVLS